MASCASEQPLHHTPRHAAALREPRAGQSTVSMTAGSSAPRALRTARHTPATRFALISESARVYFRLFIALVSFPSQRNGGRGQGAAALPTCVCVCVCKSVCECVHGAAAGARTGRSAGKKSTLSRTATAGFETGFTVVHRVNRAANRTQCVSGLAVVPTVTRRHRWTHSWLWVLSNTSLARRVHAKIID